MGAINQALAGAVHAVHYGFARELADFDFETFSEAGYEFTPENKRVKVKGAPTQAKNGLEIVGAAAYCEHPSAEVLSLAYNLKDGRGPRLWLPGMPPPVDLFEHIAAGRLLEAWNSIFEFFVWHYICVPKYGWPPLPFHLLRDAMAKARAWSLPGKLALAGPVVGADVLKMEEGKDLLDKYSKPRQTTKKNPARRLYLKDNPRDEVFMYAYNLTDIGTEGDIGRRVPDLSEEEEQLFLLDQYVNIKGVAIDTEAVHAMRRVVDEAYIKGDAELQRLTGGLVTSAGQTEVLREVLRTHGVNMPNMKEETVTAALEKEPEGTVAHRILTLRANLSLSSVKKLNSIALRVNRDGRLRGLFQFCGADTGRWAGRGPQPQNLPSGGPRVQKCDATNGCGRHYKPGLQVCPWCGTPDAFSECVDWNPDACAEYIAAIKGGWDVEEFLGEPLSVVSGCLRGLFIAGENCELICSDYSAIEAVVLAVLAGEEWRLEVFRTHGKIYEMSASKITGTPFEEFMRHKQETGEHHPMRKKVGKVAELASGYQGGYGAWCNFGADKFMTEDEIRRNIKLWRAENPAIVKFWYEMERCAIAATLNPGQVYGYRMVKWYAVGAETLYCELPSGRRLAYQRPYITQEPTPWGKVQDKLNYYRYKSSIGKWVATDTYGGKLVENITQAVARDFMASALPRLFNRGYTAVLHVHDEICAEVPKGFGSIEEFETLMSERPWWAADWPIKAAGGWRGLRFRKD